MRAAFLCLVCVAGCGKKVDAEKPGGDDPVTPRPSADMTLKAFILQKPTKSTSVEIECSLDTYYNFAYNDRAETHYSFKLKSDSPFATAHGYAPKKSEHGRMLYEFLNDGRSRRMLVWLQRTGPDGQPLPAGDDSCFALVAINK